MRKYRKQTEKGTICSCDYLPSAFLMQTLTNVGTGNTLRDRVLSFHRRASPHTFSP
uniref:Uncharacterized protein n=1 Tax=Anguilla anguilla TaxID=7936 RepID=A0A0E9WHW1_ANGAN